MKKICLLVFLLLISVNVSAEEFIFDTGTGSSIHFDDNDNITIMGTDGEWYFENNGKYFGPNAQLAYQVPFATDTNYFITGIGTFGHDKYCNGKLPEARFPGYEGPTGQWDGTETSDQNCPWRTYRDKDFRYNGGLGFGDTIHLAGKQCRPMHIGGGALHESKGGWYTNTFNVGSRAGSKFTIDLYANCSGDIDMNWQQHSNPNIWYSDYDFAYNGIYNTDNPKNENYQYGWGITNVILDGQYKVGRPNMGGAAFTLKKSAVTGFSELKNFEKNGKFGEYVYVQTGPFFPKHAKLNGERGTDTAAPPNRLYVYTGGPNPADLNIKIVYHDPNNTRNGLTMDNNAHFVRLGGIEVAGAPGIGVWTGGKYTDTFYVSVINSGKQGQQGGSDTRAYYPFVYGSVLINHPPCKFFCQGGWPSAFSNSKTNDVETIVQGGVVFSNWGEGLNTYGGDNDSTTSYLNSIVFDNWSVNVYVDAHPHVRIDGNKIGHSGVRLADLFDPLPKGSGLTSSQSRLRPEGIMAGNERATSQTRFLRDVIITNNIITNCRRGINVYNQAKGSGVKDYHIVGNTILLPQVATGYPDVMGINFAHDTQYDEASTVKNNIIQAFLPDQTIMRFMSKNSKLDVIDIDYNLFFHPTNPKPMNYKGIDYSFKDFSKKSGDMKKGIYQDPLLTRTVWKANDAKSLVINVPTDFMPQANSPAIDAGVTVTGTNMLHDYRHQPRPVNAKPDIGALERTE